MSKKQTKLVEVKGLSSLEEAYVHVVRSKRLLLAWLGDLTETLAQEAQEIRELGVDAAKRAEEFAGDPKDGVARADREAALQEAAKAHGLAVGMLTVVVNVREGLDALGVECPPAAECGEKMTLDERATIRSALPPNVRNSGPRSRPSTKTGAL